MVKVIFTNGSEMNFHAYDLIHNEGHKLFFVETHGNKRIMIPDHCVACIGIWDEEKNDFA